MDFFFFGGEAVKEVKRYMAEAAKDAEASTSLDSSEIIWPTADAEVLPAEAAEVQPAEAVAPLS